MSKNSLIHTMVGVLFIICILCFITVVSFWSSVEDLIIAENLNALSVIAKYNPMIFIPFCVCAICGATIGFILAQKKRS